MSFKCWALHISVTRSLSELGAHGETVDKVLVVLSAVLVEFVQRDSGGITALSLILLLCLLLSEERIELK